MSFLDSQLAGVIAGGIIGGMGKIFYDFNKNRKLKKNLKNGIKAEIRALNDALESGLKQYEGLFKEMETHGKLKTKYAPLPAVRLLFLEKNLEKIGILDESFLVPLVEINGRLEIIADGINIFHKTADEVFEGKGSFKILTIQLKMAIASFKGLIQLTEKVLQPEKKLIPSLLGGFKK